MYYLASCTIISFSLLSSTTLACIKPPIKIKPRVIEWICHDDGTVWVRIGTFSTFNTVGSPMPCACSLTLVKSVGEIQKAKFVIPGTDTPITPEFTFEPNANTKFETDKEQQGLATVGGVAVEGDQSADLMLDIKLGSGQSCNSLRRIVGSETTLFTDGANPDGSPSGDHPSIFEPPLPVDLIEFSATPTKDITTLNWLSGNERGISGYRVFRGKIKDIEMVSEGTISNEGKGNTEVLYSHDVPNVKSGVHAYILEVLNIDGSSAYYINEESVLVDGKKP